MVMLCFLLAMKREGASIQSIMILISLACNVPMFYAWVKIADISLAMTGRAMALAIVGGAFGVVGNWAHFNSAERCIEQQINPGNAFMITTCYPVIIALISPFLFPDTSIGIRELVRLALFLALLATYGW